MFLLTPSLLSLLSLLIDRASYIIKRLLNFLEPFHDGTNAIDCDAQKRTRGIRWLSLEWIDVGMVPGKVLLGGDTGPAWRFG